MGVGAGEGSLAQSGGLGPHPEGCGGLGKVFSSQVIWSFLERSLWLLR